MTHRRCAASFQDAAPGSSWDDSSAIIEVTYLAVAHFGCLSWWEHSVASDILSRRGINDSWTRDQHWQPIDESDRWEVAEETFALWDALCTRFPQAIYST